MTRLTDRDSLSSPRTTSALPGALRLDGYGDEGLIRLVGLQVGQLEVVASLDDLALFVPSSVDDGFAICPGRQQFVRVPMPRLGCMGTLTVTSPPAFVGTVKHPVVAVEHDVSLSRSTSTILVSHRARRVPSYIY